jgi:cation:H+ antiporter
MAGWGGLLWPALLVVSLAVLIKGSDWFTHGAERIGRRLGLPAFVIGMTVVATGTSLPELISSVLAVLRGASEIVAGNVVGSNIANLLFILGLAALLEEHLKIQKKLINVDLPFLVTSAFFLAFVLFDGEVTRPEAGFLLFGMVVYFHYTIRQRTHGAEHTETDRAPGQVATGQDTSAMARSGLLLVLGGALIYLGAEGTVRSVLEIAGLMGVGAEVVAASAVALGTSLPEVAVTLVAARRGQAEMAVGNVIGSNVFNAFAVVGLSGLVGPLIVPASIVGFALPVMVAATLVAYVLVIDQEMTRWEGLLMLAFYVFFLGTLFGLF